MSTFSVTDVAFAGYRLVRDRPKAVIWWAVFQAAASVVWVLTTVFLSAAQKANLDTLADAQTAPPGETLAAMVAVGPMFVVLFVVVVLSSAVLQAAIYRAFLTPDDSRWGYLRLGADEARMAGVMFALGSLLVFFVLVLVFVIGMGVAVGHLLPAPLPGLIDMLAVTASVALLFYAFTRFSLAAPATFAEKAVRIRRSWRMTHGHRWALMGAYLLMYASLLVTALILFAAIGLLAGIVALVSGGGLDGVGTVLRGESAAGLPLPMLLLSLALSIFQLWLVPAAAVVQLGPSAESYREIVQLEAEAAA